MTAHDFRLDEQPGFHPQEVYATVLYGRAVHVEDVAGEQLKELARFVAQWSQDHDVELEAVPSDWVDSGLTEAVVIGTVLERVSSNRSPRRAGMDVGAARAAYEGVDDDFWAAIDEEFDFGFANQKEAIYLTASGPSAQAALVYGIPVEEGDEVVEKGRRRYAHADQYPGSLEYGRGLKYDSMGPPEQRYGLFGVYERAGMHDLPVAEISLTDSAQKKRREKTADLEEPGFLLMATSE
ncbi:MAG TPA: hypothetical protein RMH99_19790 [Sandaracinaceae bacterium LLY-WYZ-13_1]|nr:hypothetical protein [Sandaracinaceae bacterium LLY-WYZ-13_1]